MPRAGHALGWLGAGWSGSRRSGQRRPAGVLHCHLALAGRNGVPVAGPGPLHHRAVIRLQLGTFSRWPGALSGRPR